MTGRNRDMRYKRERARHHNQTTNNAKALGLSKANSPIRPLVSTRVSLYHHERPLSLLFFVITCCLALRVGCAEKCTSRMAFSIMDTCHSIETHSSAWHVSHGRTSIRPVTAQKLSTNLFTSSEIQSRVRPRETEEPAGIVALRDVPYPTQNIDKRTSRPTEWRTLLVGIVQ